MQDSNQCQTQTQPKTTKQARRAKPINRRRAVLLRELGWTYKQIAKDLGCSVSWCSKNLWSIEPSVFDMKTACDLFILHNKTLFGDCK